jgi:hypothetical protein
MAVSVRGSGSILHKSVYVSQLIVRRDDLGCSQQSLIFCVAAGNQTNPPPLAWISPSCFESLSCGESGCLTLLKKWFVSAWLHSCFQRRCSRDAPRRSRLRRRKPPIRRHRLLHLRCPPSAANGARQGHRRARVRPGPRSQPVHSGCAPVVLTEARLMPAASSEEFAALMSTQQSAIARSAWCEGLPLGARHSSDAS